jgi:orotate phosphoribosyltransferase
MFPNDKQVCKVNKDKFVSFELYCFPTHPQKTRLDGAPSFIHCGPETQVRAWALFPVPCFPLQSKVMTISTNAQQLLSILARISFRLGQFKLSSGGTSDYYVDCRTTTLDAKGAWFTGHAILELLEENGIQAEAVGGLTMGADPIVSAVAIATGGRALQAIQQGKPEPPVLQGFLVRKAEKAHGTGRRIEGFNRPGARVVIVDDVCTTGASTINAIQAVREASMIVAAVVCIVEREEANGRPAVEVAAEGAPFLRLFTANDVRAEHLRQK